MVPTDESRYVGGLQPTTVSKYPFGGTCSDIPAKYNNDIRRSHIRIEKMLQKENAKQVEAAELARRILIKRRKQKKKLKEEIHLKSFDSEAEQQQHKAISEEEKELEELASSLPQQSSLMTNKWSLERAILMNGTDDEASSVLFKSIPTRSMEYNRNRLIETEKKALISRMDVSERIASRDLYHAYVTLSKNIAIMKLPMEILTECTNFICQYVTKRNGFHVKGIVSRDQSLEKDKSSKNQTYEIRKKRKIQEDLIKQVNKEKQMMGLISAVIFIEAKKIGLGRSLKDICLNFDPHLCCQAHLMKNNKVLSDQSSKKVSTILKPKFVSKAVAELKVEFPQLFQSLINPSLSAANLVHHVGEKLNLPSAAIGSIRALALFCGKEQMEKGIGAGCKPGVLCAGVTYLICRAAKVMQRLAKQALFAAEMGKQDEDQDIFDKRRKKDSQKEKKLGKNDNAQDSKYKERKRQSEVKQDVSSKKRKLEKMDMAAFADKSKTSSLPEPVLSNAENTILEDDMSISNIDTSYDDLQIHPGVISSIDPNDDQTEMKKFDALSNDPTDTESDDKELETLQGWFSWSNQSPWSRELSDIAKACDVTYAGVLEYYKRHLHPRRASLLPVVQEYLKKCQDADVCYLVNISAAVPLMILGQS